MTSPTPETPTPETARLLPVTLQRCDACSHGRASAGAVRAAVEALAPELARAGVRLELFERPAGRTRLFVGGLAPFRVSVQRCADAPGGRCDGFVFAGEFLAALTEAAVKEALRAAAGVARRGGTPGGSRNGSLGGAGGCCGSGCADCPY